MTVLVTNPASPGGTTLQIEYNNAGAFAGMAGTSWDNTNRSLTLTGATVTTNNPIFNLTQTWNAAGVAFSALKLNVTSTASAAGSLLLDLEVASTIQFSVNKDGGFRSGAVGAVIQLINDPTGQVLELRNSLNNAMLQVYPPSSLWQYGSGVIVGWSTSASAGSGCDVAFSRVAGALVEVNSGTAAGVAYARLNGVAVASLPAASATYKGARGTVTDANATLTAGIGAVVASGGANIVPVFCDGTNWRIG